MAHAGSLRDAIRQAKEAGAIVEDVRRTDEVRFSFPGTQPVTVKKTRKDTARAVRVFIRRVLEIQAGRRQVAPRR